MNFVSKLTLISCATLLAGAILPGCGSARDPVLSDNPTPPAMSGSGSRAASVTSNDNPEGGTGLSTSSGSVTGTGTNDSNSILSSIPPVAARFQAGETVNISSSTGSEVFPGPISTTPQSYLIADDGTISLPLIGNVQAAGKTPGQLQRIITQLYVPEYYVRLAVTVTALNRVYYVGGEVTKPGPEEYLGQTTVTKAIQAAGDFTVFASHKVWLTRSDGTRIQVSVDKALQDAESDPAVFPGDQIQVPRRRF
ncbi:MAG TPA: polysaccharide biosynthesis/export family protein [Candidatus Acidoferrales bacterium]|jgi:polysaccharide export outer membrane protein|nr:polysaccharide biosynthesis/export family protein [Candidatus Acidoferrales bacterium]